MRSTAYFSSAWKVPSGSGVVTLRLPRTVRKAASRASRVAPELVSTVPASPSEPARPTSRCSVETYSSPSALACSPAALMTRSSSRDGEGAGTVAPLTLGRRRSAASVLARTSAGSAPDRLQQRAGDAVGLLEQGGEQVQRLQRGLAAADREPLGGGEGFLRTGGELALHGGGARPSRLVRAVTAGRPAGGRSGATTAELSLFRSTFASPHPVAESPPGRTARTAHVTQIARGPRLQP